MLSGAYTRKEYADRERRAAETGEKQHREVKETVKLYEYQGKEILARCGIAVPKGRMFSTAQELEPVLAQITDPVMVKVQLLSGGRGKRGGVVSAGDPETLREYAGRLLQTRWDGEKPAGVLVEQRMENLAEYYLSVLQDRKSRKPLLMFSKCGGINIEETAKVEPEKIGRMYIDPLLGITDWQLRELFRNQEIRDKTIQTELKRTIVSLYRAITDYDAVLAEINPLMLLPDHTFLAADAKLEIDACAIARHEMIAQWEKERTDDDIAIICQNAGIQCVDVSETGDIGVISNGSGMVMTSVDHIIRSGGDVACAIDLGGNTVTETVVAAMTAAMAHKKVRMLAIIVFGGLTHCDIVAEGIIAGVNRLKLTVPVIVKLDGNNKEKGTLILKDADIDNIILAENYDDAIRLLRREMNGGRE